MFDDLDVDDEPARNKYLIDQYDTENKISGCLFGYVGLIVMGFAIYLINQGKNSHRFETIDEYVSDVAVSTFLFDFTPIGLDQRPPADLSVPRSEPPDAQWPGANHCRGCW